MADSDSSPPERSDLDIDLDFDLGEIDFEEDPSPTPPAEKASGDILSRDLESLLGGGGSSPNQPRSSSSDQSAAEEEEEDPEPDIEIEDSPDPDPEPTEGPDVEQGDETDAVIDEPPAAEDDADDLIEDELDELDIDDELEVDVDDAPPADQIERPDDETPEIEEDEIPEAEAQVLDASPDGGGDFDVEDELEIDDDEPSETDSALAAARRRRERREPAAAPVDTPIGEDEFEVVFDDDSMDASKGDELVVETEDEIDSDFEDKLEGEISAGSEAPVFGEAGDDFVGDLDAELDEADLADGIDDDLEEITEAEPAIAAADEIEESVPSLEVDDLDEFPDDLDDELLFEPRVATRAVAREETDLVTTPTGGDELGDLSDLADFGDVEVEIAGDAEDDLQDPMEPLVEEVPEPVSDDFGEPDHVTALSEDDLIDEELSDGLDEMEVALTPNTPPPPPDAKPDAFDDDFGDADTSEGDPDGEAESEDEFDAAMDDVPDERVQPRKLFAFKPLELAGLAAVLAVCIGGLIMLSSNVSAVLRGARIGVEEIAERVPKKLDGEIVQIGNIECYWRNRLPTDRADTTSTILPLVVLGDPSGTGHIQVLFRDSLGTIRGDGVPFRVEGGAFVGYGSETTALCTEGLFNEAQYSYYRSDALTAKKDRWNVTIRESSDGQNWVDLAIFEIPPVRRKTGDG